MAPPRHPKELLRGTYVHRPLLWDDEAGPLLIRTHRIKANPKTNLGNGKDRIYELSVPRNRTQKSLEIGNHNLKIALLSAEVATNSKRYMTKIPGNQHTSMDSLLVGMFALNIFSRRFCVFVLSPSSDKNIAHESLR